MTPAQLKALLCLEAALHAGTVCGLFDVMACCIRPDTINTFADCVTELLDVADEKRRVTDEKRRRELRP